MYPYTVTKLVSRKASSNLLAISSDIFVHVAEDSGASSPTAIPRDSSFKRGELLGASQNAFATCVSQKYVALKVFPL